MSDATTQPVDRELDVRELSTQPFDAIDEALSTLSADERLLVVNSFEPVPLYDVLESRGFTYESRQADDDEWHVLVSRAE